MSEPAKMGKRIVSKSEYARAVFRKIGGIFDSLYHYLLSIVMGASSLTFLGLFLLLLAKRLGLYTGPIEGVRQDDGTVFMSALVTLAAAGGCYLTYRESRTRQMRAANMRLNVVPLTRANAADLPAPESLVRASSEPVQAQEAVLLRAAAQGSETPSEQLVRPAGSTEG